jgi:hypothetical protein
MAVRAHPLLRAAGILNSGEPGWANRHDEIMVKGMMICIGDEE